MKFRAKFKNRVRSTRSSWVRMSLLSAAILCSMYSAPPILAEAVDDSVNTMDISDGKPLAKAGASQLKVTFEPDEEHGYTKKAWLVGARDGKVLWKRALPLVEGVNTAKTDVVCRKGQIVVLSQFPGSAAYTNQTFSWDGKTLKLISHSQGDHSQKVVDTLTRLGTSGTRAQFDAFTNEDNSLEYPGNYVNAKTIQDMLTVGHKVALALNQAHKPALAAQRLEICFDATSYLIGLVCGGDDDKKIPQNWIDQWNADAIELAPSIWAAPLNDYGFFLQESGKHKEAINVLRAVIKAQPDRAVAYLNLGDSLWVTNHNDAIKMYQKYKELVATQTPAIKVPERVATRTAAIH